jgi:hypothetical protein
MMLGQLGLLAAEAAEAESGEGGGLFSNIAKAWNEGGWGMYPIAFFLVIGFAINGAWNHAYPSMTLNIIWLVLAVYGLTRGRRSR